MSAPWPGPYRPEPPQPGPGRQVRPGPGVPHAYATGPQRPMARRPPLRQGPPLPGQFGQPPFSQSPSPHRPGPYRPGPQGFGALPPPPPPGRAPGWAGPPPGWRGAPPAYAYGQGRPPARSSGCGCGAAAIISVLVLMAMVACGSILSGLDTLSDTPTTARSSSWTPAPYPTQPSTTAPPTTTRPPTTAPPTTTRPPTSTKPAGPYTTAPRPTGGDRYGGDILNHTLWNVPAPSGDCGQWSSPATWAEMQRVFAEQLACYNALVSQAFDVQLPGPALVFHVGPIVTPCGNIDWYAWYCGANDTMYVQDSIMEWAGRYSVWTMQTVIHEYGHYLLDLTGIADAAMARGSEGAVSQQRRVELFCNCVQGLASIHMANFGPRQQEMTYAMYLGDDQHGTTESIRLWIAVGYGATTFGSCNTWAAPASAVR